MNENQLNGRKYELSKVLKIVILLCVTYLILITFSISSLIMMTIVVMSTVGLIKLKLEQIREKGPQNFSPGMRKLLFEKSIFDIYSDILYFPTVSKIIGSFIKPLLSKPSPSQLKQTFNEIPQTVRQVISTKGLFNILPKQVKTIVMKQQQLPEIKVNDWTWHNEQKYKFNQQVHQDTLAKRIIEGIDSKVNWTVYVAMIGVVLIGIKTMNPRRAKRMFIQNASFSGVLLVLMIGLIKIVRQSKIKSKYSHLAIQSKVLVE